jgi:hypothetical protein
MEQRGVRGKQWCKMANNLQSPLRPDKAAKQTDVICVHRTVTGDGKMGTCCVQSAGRCSQLCTARRLNVLSLLKIILLDIVDLLLPDNALAARVTIMARSGRP